MPHESVRACRYKLLSFLLYKQLRFGYSQPWNRSCFYPTDPRYEDEGYDGRCVVVGETIGF